MNELIETGVKAVDLYAPLRLGGRLAIGGEPGNGQAVLALEITHNLVARRGAAARYFVAGDVEQYRRALREAGIEAGVEAGQDGTYGELVVDGRLIGTLVIGADEAADSHVVLTRELVKRGQLPAVDAEQSGCRLELGEHGVLAAQARAAISDQGLKGATVLAFLRQWFTVAEPWTGQPGEYSPLDATLAGVRQLLRPA